MKNAVFRETYDFAFAAYAHMKGLKVVKAESWNKGHVIEYKFTFEDENDETGESRWEGLKLDFANSESLGFDNSSRILKRLCRNSRDKSKKCST